MISIIIPTINRVVELNNTIKEIFLQSFKNYEIIIIDQSIKSSLSDKKIINDKRIKFIHKPEIQSASAARNLGIKLATNDILLFLDDDIEIHSDDFLKTHNDFYSNPNIPGVFGCTLEKRVNQKVTKKRNKFSYHKSSGWLFFPQNYAYDDFVSVGRSCNLSVRRSFAIDVGGMDENYQKGAHREEADFCLRISNKYGKFVFSSKAIITHIGKATGGIRSWTNKTRILKAQHHYDGAIYFILKNIKLIDYPIHFLSLFLFFFTEKKIYMNPIFFLISIQRLIKSFFNAIVLILITKPKYLKLK